MSMRAPIMNTENTFGQSLPHNKPHMMMMVNEPVFQQFSFQMMMVIMIWMASTYITVVLVGNDDDDFDEYGDDDEDVGDVHLHCSSPCYKGRF